MTILNPFWGTDLYINNGDLVIDPSGDFVLLQGSDNLVQALQNRLAIEVGFLNEDPTYGAELSSIIGNNDTDEQVQLIQISTSNSLLSDPRVAAVNSISVNAIGPGNYQVQAQVSVYGSSNPLNLNFVTPYAYTQPLAPLPNTQSNEAQTSTSRTTVTTMYSLYQVVSVYLQGDTTGQFGNFYTGGSFSGHSITLGTPLPSPTQAVIVTYQTLDDIRANDVFKLIELEKGTVVNLSTVQTSRPIKCVVGVFLTANYNSRNYLYSPTSQPAAEPPGPLPAYNQILLGTNLPVGTSTVYISYVQLISGT